MDNFEIINVEEDKNKKPQLYSPAQLAFAGDAVYEMLVRAYIVKNLDYNANRIHREAIKFVNAGAQARIIKALMPHLTEEELAVFKRGRNAKVTTAPKNQEMIDYRYATGFEALFGYLYLNNRGERIRELFDLIKDIVFKK